jgi:hypothetical protein
MKNSEIFSDSILLLSKSKAGTMSCEKIRVAVNRRFFAPEPGRIAEAGNLSGSGALAIFASAKSQSHAPLCGRIAHAPGVFRQGGAARIFHRAPSERRIESNALMRRKFDGGEGPG